jgi:protein-S-isoprenylcysteine O-methyltransferase Ste14
MDPIGLIRGIWVVLGVIWAVGALGQKRAERSESSSARSGYGMVMIAAFVLLSYSRVRVGMLGERFVPDSPAVAQAGLAMVAAGALFALWARMTIGANWSGRVTIKENHELIRSGPYGMVRHPIYSGLLLAVLGTAVAIGEVGCLLAFVLAVLGWRQKWRREEEFMAERFGAEYESYKRQVKGIVPFVA